MSSQPRCDPQFGGRLAPSRQARRPSHRAAANPWWPPELGWPSSVGVQNTTRYPYFPDAHRLVVEIDGRQDVYDTGPHVITGVSQQQGGSRAMCFSSVRGSVSLDELTRVDQSTTSPEQNPPEPSRSTPKFADTALMPSAAPPLRPLTDVLTIPERLAELNRKGVITDEEFAAKKAELLARL